MNFILISLIGELKTKVFVLNVGFSIVSTYNKHMPVGLMFAQHHRQWSKH